MLIYRVKSLSKSGNAKKDPVLGPTASKESSSASLLPVSRGLEDPFNQNQVVKVVDPSRRVVENFSYNSTADFDTHASSFPPNYPFNGREESGATSSSLDREMVDVKNGFGGSISNKLFSSAQNSYDTTEDEKVQKVSPGRKVSREEKSKKQSNWTKKDGVSDPPTVSYKQQPMYDSSSNNVAPKQYEHEPRTSHDGEINAILDEEEEALISAHRKEIEETMEIVREVSLSYIGSLLPF